MKIHYACLLTFLYFMAIGRASEITIQVGGAVYAAGDHAESLSLPTGSSLLDALVAAGGCSEAAKLMSVHVKRMKGAGTEHIEVDAILCLQNPTDALILMDHDMIWVPEIFDSYPAPHYYNRLLFEWAFLKAHNKELPTYWNKMVYSLDRLGHQKTTRFKEWNEPADVDNQIPHPSKSKNLLDD